MADTQTREPNPDTRPAPTVSFYVNGGDIADALKAIAPTFERRNTIPILSKVRIFGYHDGLSFETTNLDWSMRYLIPGEYPPFEVCVDYESLAAFVRSLRGGLFRVEANATTFRLHDFMFATPEGVSFSTLGSQDFPQPPVRDYEVDFDFDPGLIAKVKLAISTEETRYYLHGVYFDASAKDEGLRLVATDGHRLNLLRTDVSPSIPVETGSTFPGAILPRAVALWLATQRKTGRMDMGRTGARWSCGPLTVWTKCIDGKFPDYERVLPGDATLSVAVDRRELISLICIAKAFRTSKSFTLNLTFDGSGLTLRHTDYDRGTVALRLASVELSKATKEPFAIGFNGNYLLAALSNIRDDVVTINFTDNTSPTPIHTGPLTQILMPCRL